MATLHIACHNDGAQVACCETGPGPEEGGPELGVMSSDLGYAMCTWTGFAPGNCSDSSFNPVSSVCDIYSPMSYFQVDSMSGSGGVQCDGPGGQGARAYCCDDSIADEEWEYCQWYYPRRTGDGWCEPYCPTGTVRLAMEDSGDGFGAGSLGGSAYCCTPHFLTDASGSAGTQLAFAEALEGAVKNQCGWGINFSLSRRDGIATDADTSALSKRGSFGYDCSRARAGIERMLLYRDVGDGPVYQKASHRPCRTWATTTSLHRASSTAQPDWSSAK